jgi:hypothetical protein
MRAAAALARSAWGAASLYTTVAASNEGARALYEEIGFGEVGEESAAWPGQTSLGEGERERERRGRGLVGSPPTHIMLSDSHVCPSHRPRNLAAR